MKNRNDSVPQKIAKGMEKKNKQNDGLWKYT